MTHTCTLRVISPCTPGAGRASGPIPRHGSCARICACSRCDRTFTFAQRIPGSCSKCSRAPLCPFTRVRLLLADSMSWTPLRAASTSAQTQWLALTPIPAGGPGVLPGKRSCPLVVQPWRRRIACQHVAYERGPERRFQQSGVGPCYAGYWKSSRPKKTGRPTISQVAPKDAQTTTDPPRPNAVGRAGVRRRVLERVFFARRAAQVTASPASHPRRATAGGPAKAGSGCRASGAQEDRRPRGSEDACAGSVPAPRPRPRRGACRHLHLHCTPGTDREELSRTEVESESKHSCAPCVGLDTVS